MQQLFKIWTKILSVDPKLKVTDPPHGLTEVTIKFKIDYLNKKQHIELTSKGQNLINLLKEVIEIIK